MKHTKNCLEGGKCDCARAVRAYWDKNPITEEELNSSCGEKPTPLSPEEEKSLKIGMVDYKESWNYPVPLWLVMTLVGVAICLAAVITVNLNQCYIPLR